MVTQSHKSWIEIQAWILSGLFSGLNTLFISLLWSLQCHEIYMLEAMRAFLLHFEKILEPLNLLCYIDMTGDVREKRIVMMMFGRNTNRIDELSFYNWVSA